MQIDYLALILRLMHILAAITAVGGTIFARFALFPVAEAMPNEERKRLHEAVRVRWARLVYLSILFLLVSGLVNFGMFIIAARDWGDEWRSIYNRTYQILFGIKFILALAIFALASILAGRSPGTQRIRDNARFWLNVNLVLALAVIVISGVMRLTHVGPSRPQPSQSIEGRTGG
jgi:hypothetical protein